MRKERGPAGLIQGDENAVVQVGRQIWATVDTTFADTLAFVRLHLWPVTLSYMSPTKPDMVEIPRALFERLTETLAFCCLLWIKSNSVHVSGAKWLMEPVNNKLSAF
jgi:hypothetical protein